MESFELEIADKTYKVIKQNKGNATFSVFNHSSFYTITKSIANNWEVIEHRFGNQEIPLQQIGLGIDHHLSLQS